MVCTRNLVFGYRFAFNGYEREDDVAGEGSAIDFGMRMYDSRLGRFFSTDLLESEFASWSPYQYAGNSPVFIKDFLGMGPTTWIVNKKNWGICLC